MESAPTILQLYSYSFVGDDVLDILNITTIVSPLSLQRVP